jgi:hypothetical protein
VTVYSGGMIKTEKPTTDPEFTREALSTRGAQQQIPVSELLRQPTAASYTDTGRETSLA